jgi:hypothetical protein
MDCLFSSGDLSAECHDVLASAFRTYDFLESKYFSVPLFDHILVDNKLYFIKLYSFDKTYFILFIFDTIRFWLTLE